MSELLPCPFCGKLDAFVERADLSCSYVFCNSCSARGPTKYQESDDEETPGEAAAIAAWNRRAQPTDSAALRDALQKKYEELLYSVASKFPGETRHETALRYIRNAEVGTSGAAAQHEQEGDHDPV